MFACKCLNVTIFTDKNKDKDTSTDTEDTDTELDEKYDGRNYYSNNTTTTSDSDEEINDASSQRQLNQRDIDEKSGNLIQDLDQKPIILESAITQFLESATGPLNFAYAKIKHSDLVVIQRTSIKPTWSLHQCLNCNNLTHAIDNMQNYFVNPQLLNNEEEINSLKKHNGYSKVFKIILNPISLRLMTFSVSPKYEVLTSKNKKLTQYFREAIRKETAATEKRIKKFTDQQSALLKKYRKQGELEFSFLSRMLNNVPELKAKKGANQIGTTDVSISNNINDATTISDQTTNNTIVTAINSSNIKSCLDTPPATPDSTPMSIGNSPNFKPQEQQQQQNVSSGGGGGGGGGIRSNNYQHNYQLSSLLQKQTAQNHQSQVYSRSNIEEAVDAGFFFEMDGVPSSLDVTITNHQMYDDDDDDIDSDDSITNAPGCVSIPRSQGGRPKSLNIAQSLPISMPISNQRLSVDEDYDDEEYPNERVDIAASIQALAKSVHGDSVFGDLPRPRFSTQI